MKKPNYKRAIKGLKKILDEDGERKVVRRKGKIVDITEETVGTAYQFTDHDLTVYQNSSDKYDDDKKPNNKRSEK